MDKCMDKNVVETGESKKKDVMVWRNKEVNNESKLGVSESSVETSSPGN